MARISAASLRASQHLSHTCGSTHASRTQRHLLVPSDHHRQNVRCPVAVPTIAWSFKPILTDHCGTFVLAQGGGMNVGGGNVHLTGCSFVNNDAVRHFPLPMALLACPTVRIDSRFAHTTLTARAL